MKVSVKFFGVIMVAGLMAACRGETYYPSVSEIICFANNTKDTIQISYPDETNRMRTISVLPENRYNYYIDPGDELFVTEAEFNSHVARLLIFRVNAPNDTSFVDAKYYDTKQDWNHQINEEQDLGRFVYSLNTLEITDNMFE
jgi:hypothetical protein